MEEETRINLIVKLFSPWTCSLHFCDHMKRKLLLEILLITLIIYIFFVDIPIMKFETEKKIIEMKRGEGKFYKNIEILLPAIEEEGEGIIASLKVEVYDGEGKTLLEINQMSFWEDTQESIRTAKSIAEKITKKDTSNYDIIYSVTANASKIEGPSAGPAMAIATSIALENKTINKSVIITGYLREDGTIGKVSGILEKAEAAKQNKIKLFLVPLGQKIQIKTETKRNCDYDIFTTFCKTETIKKEVDIQEEVGIDIIEVENISEALEYFIIE